MVSGEKAWDPLRAGPLRAHLSEQQLAPDLPSLRDQARTAGQNAACHQARHSPPHSCSPPSALADVDTLRPAQISLPGTRGPPTDRSCPAHRGSGGARGLGELKLGAASQPEAGEEGARAERQGMKGKSKQGGRVEAMIEDRLEDMADGPKNAKITLSFPLSAAPLPPSLTSPNPRRNSSSSSPSPHRRRPSSGSKGSDDGSLWKLDATMDIKHRPFKPPRHDSPPPSSPFSSTSPMTVGSFIKKDMKSPPPLKCSKVTPETQFNRFPHNRPSGGSAVGGYGTGDGWEERHRGTNGTVSPSQTAQILFNLGTSTFTGQRGRDVERAEKTNGRHGTKSQSLHGPNIQPPTLHPPPSLPPSEALTAPPHPSSLSPAESLKPELICGVCHRLFSSASSLTVHMRLHRGSRALSCRYCGKAFIHSKRLQSHEASCRTPCLAPDSLGPAPSLTVRPKEEPLEEGEVRVEGGVVVGTDGAIDSGKARPGKRARSLLARIQADDAAASELLAGDEQHFVKVVDGNVIYFCSVCERSYMTLSSLKRHSNVHSWRRKYPCHFCDKVFALAEYRTKHEVWHTGERRYQCIFCWDAFATYYNLKTHQKTIHGINPSLISSEKTANGGYKQKVNALKLYRLLPMRAQKRAYKTYNDSMSNGLLLPSTEPSPLSQGCDAALGPDDLQRLISVKPDPDAFPNDFPVSMAMEHSDYPTLSAHPATDLPQGRKRDTEAPEREQRERAGGSFKLSSSSRTKTHKDSRGAETNASSVIAYAQTKPSVIVHGTGTSSSVIVHCNQVTPSNGRGLLSSSSSTDGGDSVATHKSRSSKKQRESTERHRKRSRDSSDATGEGGSGGRQDAELGRSHHKSRKLQSKSDLSAAKHLAIMGGSQVKDAGPLCQITVRIGEEAIVKRSISETDLRRDKSRSPPKTKRTEATSTPDAKESRHPHSHHHHHKHRAHCNTSLRNGQELKGDGEPDGDEEFQGKISKSPSEVREYYFRQEVREQADSDNDAEDDLWRPYYSYKPKRKAQAHLQRAKNWQRRLQYKRSRRLMRRAERLMSHVSKETEKSPDEEEEEEEEDEDGTMEEMGQEEVESDREEEELERGKESNGGTEIVEKIKEQPSFPQKQKSKLVKEQAEEVHCAASPRHSPTPSHSTSASSQVIKRRPWTNGNAEECSTCGRWFSSARKRDKHELSHLLEFVCLFCRATFPSRDKLEDHQRAQHPRPNDTPSLPHKVALNEQGDGGGAKTWAEREVEAKEGGAGPLIRTNSSSGCLSRRALARHTCPQCHTVCKTSSALTRHVRRHELSSSPERDEIESEPKPASTTEATSVSTEPEAEKEQLPSAQSVSVISYSLPDPTSSSDCAVSPQCEGPFKNEQQICDSTEKTEELTEPDRPAPKREPSPLNINQTSSNSPVNPTPTGLESGPATPSALHSVLVMNGYECLDYRTTKRETLEAIVHRIPSPARVTTPSGTSANAPTSTTSHTRIATATPPVSMTTAPPPEAGMLKREGVIMDRERQGGAPVFLHGSYEEPASIRDLRIPFRSPRSPSPTEAQDLTMSSILAREREMERQREREMERQRERESVAGRQRERELERQRGREMQRDTEKGTRDIQTERVHGPVQLPQEGMPLLVPKEEPLSPAASPKHVPTPTTVNVAPSPRHAPRSPRRSPNAINPFTQVKRQAHQPLAGADRSQLLSGAIGPSERPSAHALLLHRAPPPPEPDYQDTPVPRDTRQAEDTSPVDYPVQDLPLPLIMSAGYRLAKKQQQQQQQQQQHEEGLLMSSYPAGALPFGPLGKVMVPAGGELAKLPFYQDPYQLLYGPQLLAYPYNLAALPVALNMMGPGGDKMEPLPFLPAIFNYAAAAPYMGAAQHHLLANPSLYGGGGGGGGGCGGGGGGSGGKKQREGGGNKS